MRSSPSRSAGFTLLELMIVVAIVAILTAIALPSYRDYVIRGNLVDGTNQLAAWRSQMEQYYQDARQYTTNGTAFVSPCDSPSTSLAHWTFSCAATPATYTLTASGVASTPVAGFTYTIDNNNTQKTTTSPSAAWGTSTDHWVMKKGG